jgi:heat shock protein HslJ
MWKRLLALGSLLLMSTFSVAAQATHTVSWNDIRLTVDAEVGANVQITQFAEDSVDDMLPDAPHTRFVFYSGAEVPEQWWDAPLVLRVYDTADLGAYALVQAEYDSLQQLLNTRPELGAYALENPGTFPYSPPSPSDPLLAARARYIDTGAVNGVAYMTAFRLDVSPFIASDPEYVFQGVSSDGTRYIVAHLNLTTTVFPAETPADFDYDALAANFEAYVTNSVSLLNAAAEGDFSPALSTLDTLIMGLQIGDSAVNNPGAPEEPAPPGDPTVPVDPSIGGLVGTWSLVSYGDPNAPTVVLPNTLPTLTFDATGVSGNASCNGFGGSFTYDQGNLSISNLASTMMACMEPEGVMEQEMAFTTALLSATTYIITGDQLTITYAGGVLTLVRAT